MNTFWLKAVGFVVIVLGLIILVNVFSPSESEPKAKRKTFYDVIEEDDKRLRADPEAEQPPETEQRPVTKQTPEVEQAVEAAKPKFKKLSLEDELQAQKLFEWALAQRKMARLPGMSYDKMVDACREIIEKWPNSVYAFKARRMLRDIPERYRKLYRITGEEMGLSN